MKYWPDPVFIAQAQQFQTEASSKFLHGPVGCERSNKLYSLYLHISNN